MWGPDDQTSVANRPATPPAGPSAGWFRDAIPEQGISGTIFPAWLGNMLLAEMRTLVAAAGLALNKADDSQITQAVKRLAWAPRIDLDLATVNLAESTLWGHELGFVPIAPGVVIACHTVNCPAPQPKGLPEGSNANDSINNQILFNGFEYANMNSTLTTSVWGKATVTEGMVGSNLIVRGQIQTFDVTSEYGPVQASLFYLYIPQV